MRNMSFLGSAAVKDVSFSNRNLSEEDMELGVRVLAGAPALDILRRAKAKIFLFYRFLTRKVFFYMPKYL